MKRETTKGTCICKTLPPNYYEFPTITNILNTDPVT